MVSVPAKKVATFKPGKEFAASLNQDGAPPAA
jgi:nucleoid DNA-binding protein